jgi:hypothetical protein
MRKILLIALCGLALAAWIVSFWAQTEALKKARDAGYRYWLIDPRAVFYQIKTKESAVSILAGLLMVAAVGVAYLLKR